MAAYHRPTTLEQALAIRAGADVTVLAGGTDVYPARAARVGWGDMRQGDILDITAVPSLRGIAEEEAAWRIGALTTWTDLMRADLPALFDGLKLAAREIGGAQIQNRGTLAGNICTASPAGDGAPNLLALDAHVELASRQSRRVVPMRDFIDGYRHTQCRSDEIVTALLVPKPRGASAQPFPQARRAALPRHLHRHGGGRGRDGRCRQRGLGAGGRRLVLGRAAALAGAGDGASRPASRGGGGHRCAGASGSPRAHRRHPRLGRLSAARGAGAGPGFVG